MTSNPTAIVTGASSGIGREVAIQLGKKGYDLALVGRSEDGLKNTAAASALQAGASVRIKQFTADLCDQQAARGLPAWVSESMRGPEAIVNVAGYAPMMPIEQVTDTEWQRCVGINLSAVINMTAAAWPLLKQRGRSVIANVSSMAAFDPYPGLSIYAVAKAGLNMLTSCAATEGEPYGIKTVGIAPGAVETPMLRSLFDENTIPRDKTLDPADVAALICGCITGERTYQSGETILYPSPD